MLIGLVLGELLKAIPDSALTLINFDCGNVFFNQLLLGGRLLSRPRVGSRATVEACVWVCVLISLGRHKVVLEHHAVLAV